MSEFLTNFAARLKPDPDQADGEDYALAERNMPEHITRPIPTCCVHATETADPLSGRMVPAVYPVMEAVNVLAWVMIRKVNPTITLEEVAHGINRENRWDIIDDIWYFWTGEKLRSEAEDEDVVFNTDENPTILAESQLNSPEPTSGEA